MLFLPISAPCRRRGQASKCCPPHPHSIRVPLPSIRAPHRARAAPGTKTPCLRSPHSERPPTIADKTLRGRQGSYGLRGAGVDSSGRFSTALGSSLIQLTKPGVPPIVLAKARLPAVYTRLPTLPILCRVPWHPQRFPGWYRRQPVWDTVEVQRFVPLLPRGL